MNCPTCLLAPNDGKSRLKQFRVKILAAAVVVAVVVAADAVVVVVAAVVVVDVVRNA